MIMALGAVALGYAHPAVVEAVSRALAAGGTGSLAPVEEEQVADRLCTVLPGAEAVRFFKTGAEAVAAAVRIARVHTGRDRVVTCGYHGWLDWCQTEAGVPEVVRRLRSEIPFNDIACLDAVFALGEDIAAFVVEPVIDGPPSRQWLAALCARTRQRGTVLIFDEIKTAFRVAVGGAAERWGVTPDLMVIGKALGTGVPIAAVLGGRDLMGTATSTWISSTLATETLGLAAAGAVLDTYEREPVIEHLEQAGRRLFDTLAVLAGRYSGLISGVRGLPQMCYLRFKSPENGAALARAAAHRGVLFKRDAYNYVSYAHTDDVLQEVAEALDEAMEDVVRQC
jgi:glutamate-1-semialdehyde 2,1-aminomutase